MNRMLFCLAIFAFCWSFGLSQENTFESEGRSSNARSATEAEIKLKRSSATSLEFETNLWHAVDVIYTESYSGIYSYDALSKDSFSKNTQSYKGRLKINFLKPSTEYVLCTLSSVCIDARTTSYPSKPEHLWLEEKNASQIKVAWDVEENNRNTFIKFCLPFDSTDLDEKRVDCKCINDISNETSDYFYESTEFSTNSTYIPLCDSEIDIKICVTTKVNIDEIEDAKCIVSSDPTYRDLNLAVNDQNYALNWDKDEIESNHRFFARFEFPEFCEHEPLRWKEDIKDIRPGTILFSANDIGPVTVLLLSEKENRRNALVGRTVFHGNKKSLNDSVIVYSSNSSLTFHWRNPYKTDIPVDFLLESNGSLHKIEYNRFVGCNWIREITKLDPFTNYNWSLTINPNRTGGNFNGPEVFTGEKRTDPVACGKISKIEVKVHLSNAQKTNSPEILVHMPKNRTGIPHQIKITIKDKATQITFRDEFPACDYGDVCSLTPRFKCAPDKRYEITASCSNKEPQNTYEFWNKDEFETDSVVPDLAKEVLHAKKTLWSEGGYSNTAHITIDHDQLDKLAGEIKCFYVLYGPPGTLPERKQRGLVNNSVQSGCINDSYAKEINTLYLDAKEREFFLSNLSYGTEYNVMLRFRNSRAYSSSSMITFRTPDNYGNIYVFFALVFSIYIYLCIHIAFLSTKNKSVQEMEIPFDLVHPEAPNFSFPISKKDAKETLRSLLEQPRHELKKQFQNLDNLNLPFAMEVGSTMCNIDKNRYVDIIPYDYSRVILKIRPGMPGEDYINASYIHGYSTPLAFIATQGPTKSTIDDFWRMIWEKNVKLIVMLTKCSEGLEKCSKYWPSLSTKNFDVGNNMTVKNLRESCEPGEDYHVRKFEITKNWDKRTVQQFHFITWLDRITPYDNCQVIKMIQEIKDLEEAKNLQENPIVVHCSAGIGRTGTFIGLWNLIDELNDPTKDSLNILASIFKMRLMRVKMVQSQIQLFYLYECLLQLVDPEAAEGSDVDDKMLAKKGFRRLLAGTNLYFDEDEGLEPLTDEEEEEEEEIKEEKEVKTETVRTDEKVEDKEVRKQEVKVDEKVEEKEVKKEEVKVDEKLEEKVEGNEVKKQEVKVEEKEVKEQVVKLDEKVEEKAKQKEEIQRKVEQNSENGVVKETVIE